MKTQFYTFVLFLMVSSFAHAASPTDVEDSAEKKFDFAPAWGRVVKAKEGEACALSTGFRLKPGKAVDASGKNVFLSKSVCVDLISTDVTYYAYTPRADQLILPQTCLRGKFKKNTHTKTQILSRLSKFPAIRIWPVEKSAGEMEAKGLITIKKVRSPFTPVEVCGDDL